MAMRLDLDLERLRGVQNFIYIPSGRILRKPSSLEKGIYCKEVDMKFKVEFHPSPTPPNIYPPLLSLIFLYSLYQHLHNIHLSGSPTRV